MTVFDVRLGWWVGNPRHEKTYHRATHVNLSDRGFFDNMDLYELIQRRCRYIIVCDAEQDAELKCASLITTLRNCRMDFEVKVEIARPYHQERGCIQRRPLP